MKVDTLLELGVQPTDFAKVKSNAQRVFGGDIGFYVVEKDDPANKSEPYLYSKLDFLESDEDKKEYQGDMVEEFAEEHGLKPSQVKVVTIDAATPNFDSRGKLLPNQTSTYSQRVTDTMGAYKDARGKNSAALIQQAGAVTVANVKEIVAQHPDRDKHVHMNSLLDALISGSGKPWVPQVIVDGVNDNNITGDLAVGKYVADFGEIGGPIGLVCSSINGNAPRVLPNFLGTGDRPADPRDIKSNAVIHFHPSKGHSLVDSYIEYNGQIVRVSSKAAGDKMSGGQGATFKGIYQSISEIATSDEGVNAFNKLITKRPGAKEGLRKLKILANVLVDDEGDTGRSVENFDAFRTKLILLQELLKNTKANKYNLAVTNDDIAILNLLWNNGDPRKTSVERFNRFKAIIGQAFGSEISANAVARDPQLSQIAGLLRGKKFSPGFFNLTRSFKLNLFGEPSTSGTENPKRSDEYNSTRGWWLRLKKSIIYAIANQVNSDPEFSMLCTWILNHGKFIQIDTRSKVQNDSLIITNIVATWPSTAVDRVILVPTSAATGFKYKLLINSDRDWREEAKQNYADASQAKDYADDNFGFADTKEKMKPTRVDLARMNRHWDALIQSDDSIGDIIGSDERRVSFSDPGKRAKNPDNRTSTARKKINNLFADMSKEFGIAEPKDDAEQNAAVEQIVTSILLNTMTDVQYSYVRRFIEYALEWAHSSSRDPAEYVNVRENQDDDDDDDDEEETGENNVEITRTKRQIGTDDRTRLNQLFWPIYYAVELNRALINSTDYRNAATKLSNSLSALGSKINVNQFISRRTSNTDPDIKDYTPPNAKVRGAPKNQKPESIRAMISFLSKYNLYGDELSAGRGSPRVQKDYGPIGDKTARTYRFCTAILLGKYDNIIGNISRDVADLLSNPSVANLISWETRNTRQVPSFDQINHADDIYNNIREAKKGPQGHDTEEKVISSITLIYWTLLIKRYVETGNAKNNNINFVRTLQTTQSVANGIIRDRNNREEFMRALRAIKARGGSESISHSVSAQNQQSFAPQVPTQPTPSKQDIINTIASVKKNIDPEDFGDYRTQIQNQASIGKSAEEIISMLNAGQLDESKSNILRGILG